MRTPDLKWEYAGSTIDVVNDGTIRLLPNFRKLVKAEGNNLELRVSAHHTDIPFLILDPKAQRKQFWHGLYDNYDIAAAPSVVVSMNGRGFVDLPPEFYKHIGVQSRSGQIFLCGLFDHMWLWDARHKPPQYK